MVNWKTWRLKNAEYCRWYKKESFGAFSIFWFILKNKFMTLVPNSNSKEDLLLDVGCGDGRYLLSSIQDKGYFGIGLDPNKKVSLIPTRNKIKAVSLDYFLVKSIGEKIPLKNCSLSIVLCNSTLDHSKDPDIVLGEIFRILKKNGTLILWQGIYRNKHTQHETHLRTFTAEELISLVKIAGFKIQNSYFLGCNLIPISDSYRSMSSKFPTFLNKLLVIIFQMYLLVGNYLPNYASILFLRMRKI